MKRLIDKLFKRNKNSVEDAIKKFDELEIFVNNFTNKINTTNK